LHRSSELEDTLTSAIGIDVSILGLVRSEFHQIYALVDKMLRSCSDLRIICSKMDERTMLFRLGSRRGCHGKL
jgi:hypothetical protein